MDSSEEEELFLLGFILLEDKRKKKETKKRQFWVREIFPGMKDKECYQVFFVNLSNY